MILLKKIQITNFLSHKDTELDFAPDSQLLIDGVSGSGKSSIVDALIWALYGHGRSDNRNLIRHGTKQAEVELILADGDTDYKIIRKVSDKAKQTLEVSTQEDKEWMPLKKIGLKDAQNWIETELLHCSYTLFINSVVAPQDNVENFVQQTASKRKEMLLEVINAADFELYYNRAKEKIQLLNEDLSRSRAKIEINQNTIKDNKDLVDSMLINKTSRDATQKKLESLRESLDALYAKKELHASLRGKINSIEGQIDNIQSQKLLETSQVEEKVAKIKEIQNRQNSGRPEGSDIIVKSKEALVEFQNRLEQLEEIEAYDYVKQQEINKIMASKPQEIDYESEIKRLEEAKDKTMEKVDLWCPDFKKICPKLQTELNDRLKDTETRIGELMELKMKQADALSFYQLSLETLGELKWHHGPDNLREEIKKIRWQIDTLQAGITEREKMSMSQELIDSLQKEIDYLNESLKAKTDAIERLESGKLALMTELAGLSQLEAQLMDTNTKIIRADEEWRMADRAVALSEQAYKVTVATQEEIKKLTAENASKEEDVFNLELVKEAFGTKGIKTIVVEMLVPRLEDKINEILGKISNFSVRLETQKSSADGDGTIEGFYINIINDQGETFEFSSYSGGEKNRINYAIFESLASLQKCNVRIFDESFSGINNEVLDDMADTMLNLGTGKQVICISHIDIIKEKFSDRIEVKKINGISKIV